MKEKKQRITVKSVHYCLKNLGDPVALKQSALIALPPVASASRRYNRSQWAQAYALRDLLVEVCNDILTIETSDQRMQRALYFLRLYLESPNVAAAARALKMDRKNVYTCVMPIAFGLVAEQLERACFAARASTP